MPKRNDLPYSEFAVVFVHPFWLMKHDCEDFLKRERQQRAHGSYKKYCDNIAQAYRSIKDTSILSVFLLPFETTHDGYKPVATTGCSIEPNEDSLVFEWSFLPHDHGIETKVNRVTFQHDTYEPAEALSSIDDVIGLLKGQVNHIAVCGEMGPHARHRLGCVGSFALQASKRMQVRGLEGCVYPLKPYENRYVKGLNGLGIPERLMPDIAIATTELRNATKMLYENTLTLEECLKQRPIIMVKDGICKALTGHTQSEWLDVISKKYTDPIAHAPGDEPRSDGDKFIDAHMLFTGTQFTFPIRTAPASELYTSFKRFRDHERYLHPAANKSYELTRSYWDPVYDAIEKAYQANDEQTFRAQLSYLVDRVIHD